MALLKTRILDLMTLLHWNGIDDWHSLDRRVQETYIPQAQTWLLRHIKYLPETPERDGLTPRSAVEMYYTDGTTARGWRQHEVRQMGVTALIALYNIEQDRGWFDR